jgi:molybdopterin converting factor subunit 1
MTTIQVKVLYFARAREVVGKHQEMFSLGSPSDTDHLRAELLKIYPTLAGLLTTGTLAVNEEYVDGLQTLTASDVVAVIPPISGG